MNTKDAIVKGIGAHGLWKQRLTDAISSGQSEWTPDVVCQDNQCEFGKWLYSCSPEEQASPHYGKIKDLHAQFHVAAADVLRLALAGKQTEAEQLINDDSKYRDVSTELTLELMDWSKSIA